jgi:prepilin-type N-terminal cleavage/methylation domain-containing protein/prepilin-type processing-associated H-X9-DG protein
MKRKHGFTLIELLVVIAIIALLLSMTMPSLMGAKERAKGVFCRSNLRQMCIAASTYSMDNNGFYPSSYYNQTISVSLAQADYSSMVVQPEVPDQTETIAYNYCWDFTTITTRRQTLTMPGLLWQGDTIEKIQQCPAYKGADNWTGNTYTGYNYNTSYIGHGQNESVAPSYSGTVIKAASGQIIVLPARASHVKNPGATALFGDGQYAGGANKMMRSPLVWAGDMDWNVRLGGTQGYRHSGQTNIGWVDGHVTAQSEIYTDTHPKYKAQLDAYNRDNNIRIGFISPDNSLYDLK